MGKAQIYYDDCCDYDGDPGWSLRQPDEVCDMSLDGETIEECTAELLAAGYDEIEVIDKPD